MEQTGYQDSLLKLNHDILINSTGHAELSSQLKLAEIEATKERLFVNILDTAFANPDVAKPNSPALIVIITFFGMILSIIYILISYSLSLRKEDS